MSKFKVDITAVGGGGGGGTDYYCCTGGGGGGGWVVKCIYGFDNPNGLDVIVGKGGCGATYGCNQNTGCDGEYTCITYMGGPFLYAKGGTPGMPCIGGNSYRYFGLKNDCYYQSGGGGGAGSSGAYSNFSMSDGGLGRYGYGGGGGGAMGYTISSCSLSRGCGRDGGGMGGARDSGCNQGGDGENGGGGGGGVCGARGGNGGDGLVEICYPLNGIYGFNCATGGDCCYECNGMMVHRFDTNGTFALVYGLFLNKSKIYLVNEGETEQLTATKYLIDGDIVWSSSDESVATVDKNGLVTCVTPGECVITATCGEYSASCEVKRRTQIYADILLVGGGGAGGRGYCRGGGGGGGGGGIISCQNYCIPIGEYPISIGDGGIGTAASYDPSCTKGCDTTFNGLTAYGGGGGGGMAAANYGVVGGSGGSGGGGGGCCDANCTISGGACCYGQGKRGGSSCGPKAGSGGGWCEAGKTCSSCVALGGCGYYSDISGSGYWYASGGNGGWTYASDGICGGGGTGGFCCSGCPATTYGSGGGGGSCGASYCRAGGNGKQGIFILRYPTACGYDVTGGTCYTCGDYTIYCFTSSGTLTIN